MEKSQCESKKFDTINVQFYFSALMLMAVIGWTTEKGIWSVKNMLDKCQGSDLTPDTKRSTKTLT